MTTRDLRLLALVTVGATAVGLGGVGIMYGMRWGMRTVMSNLAIQVDALVSSGLLFFVALCAVVAVLGIRYQFRWLPHRGGR